ncbi:tubulin epsilon and delta complex protein 1-like isoform X2 [Myxocyprinus asiaticus]|uniref:tubulin epsilon and delta complex protein 1-like isoform X2 n=1 Tax=Myxocyprinus asiaticus TaxID=70543 RepID=UPI0022218E6D|nr:tubulin epsilon and delta complex protein 1-like isoform X2 [Myxocyprinus asiaticus]
MQREKSVNVKEVIASLCRILSGLSVESIPTADAFRRAKFNKQDAAMDMWILLNGLLLKAFALDCACQNAKDQQFDTQLLFVRSALWHCGYGAPWVVAPRPPSHLEEVGSRELLLAFGWVLSSGKLLEFLLAEKVHDLDTLSSAPRVPQGLILGQEDIVAHGAEADSKETVRNDQALRALQWQYGKLRLQWKSLLSAQEERSRLIHRVLSKINPSAICQNNVTGSHQSDMTSTALDKDSVIDSSLADTSEMKQADCPLGGQAVTLRCPHGDKARRAVRRLDKMLLRLQTELRVRRIEQSTLTLTSQGRHQEAAPLSDRQKMEVDEKVAGYLEGLHLTNTSTITSRGFLPCLQDPHPVKPSHRFHTGDSGLPVTAGKVQASWALGELKEREATLQLRLERLRQNIRVEMQRQASTIDGVVLIPPINK